MTLLSSKYDTEITFKNIEPPHSCGEKEKEDKGTSCSTDNIIPYSLRSLIASSNPELSLWRSRLREEAVESLADPAGSSWMWSPTIPIDGERVTAIDPTDIRGSFKRTANNAGLREGGEGVYRLEKARCEGQYAGTSLCG